MLFRKSFLILFIAGTFLSPVFGQVNNPDPKPAGLDMDDDEYDNIELLPDDGSKAVLPSAVSLEMYAPIPQHQGDIESCVGWSLSYGVMTIEYAKRNGWRNNRRLITENAFSPTFIYSQLAKRQECGPSKLSEALELLKEVGNVPDGEFEGNKETCSYELSPEMEEVANQYRITGYQRLFDQNDPIKKKVYKAKQALAARKPIVIGMKINNNFMGLKQGARIWYPAIGGDADPPFMGHAMTVIGFNDRNNTFKLLNSWGRNWGNGGTIDIKYQDFGLYCKYGYIINIQDEDLPQSSSDGIDGEEEIYASSDPNDPAFVEPELVEEPTRAPRPPRPNPDRRIPREERSEYNRPDKRPSASQKPPQRRRPLRKLAASFKFNYLHENDTDNPLFLESEVRLHRDYYQLKKLDWELGQMFQMVTRTRTNKEYMYVFSLDPEGEVMIHWPRKANLDPRFSGQNESALVLHRESTVYFPGKNRAFTLDQPGKHTMIVLFSKRPLNDFKTISRMMKGHNEFPSRKLEQILGKRQIPWSDVTYEENSIGFEALTRSRGYVVPLIFVAHKR